MADYEKFVPFGAAIEGPTKPQPVLRSSSSKDSDMSTTSVDLAEKETPINHSNPFSAFYQHPDARRSMDESVKQSKTHLEVGVYERDLEAGLPLSAATTQNPKCSVDGKIKECTMWPSRQSMIEKKKKHKRSRGCNLFRDLNNKQRLWAKIIIALFVVAVAVALGVGISRAVGGRVWTGNGTSKSISNH